MGRKTLIVLGILVFLAQTSRATQKVVAQATPNAVLKVAPLVIKAGLKAGLILSNVAGSDAPETSFKPGLGGGGFVLFLLKPFLIQPEVLYVQKGFKLSGVENAKMELDYLEVPVLVKFPFMPRSRSIWPFIEVGPTVSFLLNAKQKTGDVEINVMDQCKKVDFGLTAGLGTDYGPISLDARYTFGFVKVPETSGTGDEIKNGNFLVTLGYSFK